MSPIEENRPQVDTGKSTLDIISHAHLFNRWMFTSIEEFIEGKILEIGSGIGNISQYIIDTGHPVHLSDENQEYVNVLKDQFGQILPPQSIYRIDVVDPNFKQINQDRLGMYNTIIAMNVLEHIQDHSTAIENLYSLLSPRGTCILLVPSYPDLFNTLDENLGHYRRYTKKSIQHLIAKTPFHVQDIFYFNVCGVIPWYLCGNIFRFKNISAGQMKIYNVFVPVFQFFDFITGKKLGLSIIVVLKRK